MATLPSRIARVPPAARDASGRARGRGGTRRSRGSLTAGRRARPRSRPPHGTSLRGSGAPPALSRRPGRNAQLGQQLVRRERGGQWTDEEVGGWDRALIFLGSSEEGRAERDGDG